MVDKPRPKRGLPFQASLSFNPVAKHLHSNSRRECTTLKPRAVLKRISKVYSLVVSAALHTMQVTSAADVYDVVD